jgi:uncharacterized membrane protein YfcA
MLVVRIFRFTLTAIFTLLVLMLVLFIGLFLGLYLSLVLSNHGLLPLPNDNLLFFTTLIVVYVFTHATVDFLGNSFNKTIEKVIRYFLPTH